MDNEFKMTKEDIEEYKSNAIERLRNQHQYATAKAVEIAFNALAVLGQYKWERDVAIEQLKEIGLGFGSKTDLIWLTQEAYKELLEYKFMYEDLCG